MTKYLITGGAGFIGSSLAERLITKPDSHITIIDNLLTGTERNIQQLTSHKNFRVIVGDINDSKFIDSLNEEYFDYIYHFAAVVGVKRTLENPHAVLEDLNGFNNIYSYACKVKAKRVFFASSSEVYGESRPQDLPQHELTTPLNARLPYATVKLMGEVIGQAYMQSHNMPLTIFRFFNTYGPKQSSDFVVSKLIKSAIKNEPLTVYGDGSQTRTFCFVDDNVDTMLSVLENDSHHGEIINIGNDIDTSVLELAEMIIRVTGSSSEIVHLPALKAGDMPRRRPDNTKMKNILGRKLLALEEGLKRVIDSWNNSNVLNLNNVEDYIRQPV